MTTQKYVYIPEISWSFLDSPSDGVYHMQNQAFLLSGTVRKED